MSTMQIGKPNYNRTNTEKLTYYRLGMKENQRELTVFIAPPIKSMAADGNYAAYLKQHFGYTTPGKADKPIPMTFNCLERKDKNQNIVQECPECNEISLRKTSVETMEIKLKASNTPPEIIEAQLRPQRDWLKSHNLDRKWNLLAKSESGVWGILTLSHTAFKDLQREITDLRKLGVEDPIGQTGVWFSFTRTGTAFNDIKDTCKAVQIRDGKSFSHKYGTLTELDLQALEAMPELITLGRKISYEQIKMLVESGGDENVVKSVFNLSQKTETSPVRTSPVPTTVQLPVNNPVVQNMPPPQTQVTAPATPAALSQEALMAQLKQAQDALAKLQIGKTSTPSQPVNPQPGPSMTTSLDMDPDEFMAKFGQG